jgi:carbon storage regulator
MLVVTRKQDESVIIGNEIEVMILRIDRHSVRIGIKAPRHISVHRKEIFVEIMQENIAASSSQLLEISKLQEIIGTSGLADKETKSPVKVSDKPKGEA